MWKFTIFTTALALKVQKEGYPQIPVTLDGAVSSIDTWLTQQDGALQRMATFIPSNQNAAPVIGEMNLALDEIHDVATQIADELQDVDLMKDQMKALPWIANEVALESWATSMAASDDSANAANELGFSQVSVHVDTEDFALDNYRKKGLASPPVPGWSISLPAIAIQSLKLSVARAAHELETINSQSLLPSFDHPGCAGDAAPTLAYPAGCATDGVVCGQCTCTNDESGDVVPSCALGGNCNCATFYTDER